MELETTQVDTIISELISKKEIPFEYDKSKENEDNNMKIEIVKFACLNNDKLSIKNLFNNNYPEIIINSFLSFLKSLQNLSIKGLINSYEPEDYRIQEINYFQFYIKFTNKELLPFFLMLGFYSYVNLRKNNIKQIKQFQSNTFFDELNSKYIKCQNKLLPNIIDSYCDIILGEKKEEGQIHEISKDELIYLFNQYSFYNKVYNKGDIFELVNSIFYSITENLSSLYLTNGKDYGAVNELIITLLDIIEENLSEKETYNNIDDLIISLSNIMAEFGKIYSGANYANFVMKYSDEFKNNLNDEKLEKICLFFKGLNPSYFEQTFKKITNFYCKDYYSNIEKYYVKLNFDKKEESKDNCEIPYGKIKENDDTEEKTTEFSDNSIYNNDHFGKKFEEDRIEKLKIEKIEKERNYINKIEHELKDEQITTNNIDNNNNNKNVSDNCPNEKKENIHKKLEIGKCIEESQKLVKKGDEKAEEKKQNVNEGEIKQEKEIKAKEEEIITNEEFKEKKNLSANNEIITFPNNKDIYIIIKEMQEQLNVLQKELNENKKETDKYKKKSEENFKKYKKSQEDFEKYKNESKIESDELKKKLFSFNKELQKVKDELICIKMRDISKVIINKYIHKFRDDFMENDNKKYLSKKEKSYIILEKLQGKEKYYFGQIIDKHYEFNSKSHISDIFKKYDNIKTKQIVKEVKKFI